MPTLDIALAGLQNYSTAPLSNQVNGQNISNIKFTNTVATTASFNASQFGGANISNSVAIEGSGSSNAINVAVTAAGTFSAAGWTFTNWSNGPDGVTITATGAGDFNLIGSRKNDVINASAGGATLEGGFGSDTLNGGAGNDTFFIRFPNQLDPFEVISGGGGTDRIAISTTSNGDATFTLSSATISSVEVLDFVSPYSGAHNVRFYSSQFGGGGLSSALRVEGTDADDFVNIFIDTAVMDASGFDLVNPAGSFHFNGTGYAERIDGSSARDVFLSRGGADTLIGGAGNDTFNYYAADDVAAGTQISGGSGIDELLVGVFSDDFDFTQANLSSIERIVFNSAGNSVKFNSTQFGAGLSNTLELAGSSGADVVRVEMLQTNSFSAAGWDVSSFGADDRVELVGTLGSDTITGSGSNDLILGGIGNDSINGGAGNDSIEGGIGNDTIIGGTGNDNLNGGSGNDNLNGGTGNDTLAGLAGADTLTGGSGTDVANYAGDAAAGGTLGVYVNLAGGTAIDGFGNLDNLSGIEVIYGTNGIYTSSPAWSDFIIGSAANETFVGFGGNDYLDMGEGLDTACGGDGDDFLFGGAGNDILLGEAGNDFIVSGAGSDYLVGGAGQDYYYNVAAGDYVAGDFDTFADLGADDYIFMPLALQGVTGVIDYEGGALIYTSVAGGNWYGFVSGQSAAFTQGHVLFG